MRLSVEYLAEKYRDNLFSVAFNVCKNAQDSEDIVQETFLRYYKSHKEFENEEHIKAWLMRVAINQAKDMILSFWNRNRIPFEEYMLELPFETEEDSRIFSAVMNLPRKYRIVLHLFYYEDYDIKTISKLTGSKENTIKSRLARGRKLLKDELKEAWNEDE